MRKIAPILMSVLILTLAASCSQPSEETRIKKVAHHYAYAMANYKVEKAERYATEETCNTTLRQAHFYATHVSPEYIESDTPAKIEITQLTILDDTSAYTIYHKTTPIKDFSDTLQMRKRNGEWKAHVTIPVVKLSISDTTAQ